MQTIIKESFAKPLKISIAGMEQRALNGLQLFFRNICHDDYILVNEAVADISIIDMDAVHAEQIRKEHSNKYPDRPIILASLLKPEHDGIFLQKPIQPEELISTLDQIRKALQETSQALIPDTQPSSDEKTAATSKIDILQPSALDGMTLPATALETKAVLDEKSEEKNLPQQNPPGEIISLFPDAEQNEQPVQPRLKAPAEVQYKEKTTFIYNPANYLQGHIQKAYQLAQQTNRNVSVKGPWRPIIIIPETREIWVEQSHAHLYALSVMPVRAEDVTIKVLNKGLSPPEKGGSVQHIEFFLWKLAMRTARGRIPIETDLRAPVYLSHWPNLSRLMPIQHGLRIAALWANQPVSLMETATILNIAPKYVFSFYSVANALGLVEQRTKNSGDKKPSPVSSRQENERRGLFRKILARLHRRSQ